MRGSRFATVVGIVLALAPEVHARISSVRVVSKLAWPDYVTAPSGDSRLFILEQGGKIRILQNGVLLSTPFLDLTAQVGGAITQYDERGLLGLAFSPNYATSGVFYVMYTRLSDTHTIIARYVVSSDPNRANAATAETLFDLPKPFANHNGGTILFGPDGMLYIGLGDGGGAGDPNNNAQNDSTLLGKMLRVDVSGGPGSGYRIPPDNPFVGPGGPLDEIWAKGLRNPYRFSFDRMTGDIYIGDVGQATIEEVDVQPASSNGGENYGWRITEGSMCYNPNPCDKTGLTLPVYEYTHDGSPFRCSVTGGHVYRGAIQEIRGHYFFADYCSAQIWSFVWSAANGVTSFQDRTAALKPDIGSIGAISSFGEDGFGELYVIDRGNGSDGEVFKIVTLVENDQADNDLNGDGKSDILFRHQSRGENSLWTMNGTSVLGKAALPTVADLNQEMVGSADFNGDGKYDVLWRNKASGALSIWLMNGATVLSQGSLPTVGDLGWQVVSTRDYDGDGKGDILWFHRTLGQVYVWLLDGISIKSQGYIAGVADLNWQIVASRDFNGDGKSDLLWRHKTLGHVYLWFLNGAALGSHQFVGTVGDLNWQIAGSGDFNGDGRFDILWLHQTLRIVYVWQMQGASLLAQGAVATVSDNNWEISGTGDYSGDGRSDILWYHRTLLHVYVWQMSGSSIISQGQADTVAEAAWKIVRTP